MQCYSTFFCTFNEFDHTMIMHIILWLWYILWLCNTKLQGCNPSMTEVYSHSWVRKLKHYSSKNSIHFLYVQENEKKKYLPLFNSFHKKTLSAYFRNAAGLSCPDWKVKVGFSACSMLLADTENAGKQKGERNRSVKYSGCYPFTLTSHSLTSLQAQAEICYL